jgi:hypothetical protein
MNTTLALMIVQRLSSKTYWAAAIMSILTFIEYNYDILSLVLPESYRPLALVLWPMVMTLMRELTTTAVDSK